MFFLSYCGGKQMKSLTCYLKYEEGKINSCQTHQDGYVVFLPTVLPEGCATWGVYRVTRLTSSNFFVLVMLCTWALELNIESMK